MGFTKLSRFEEISRRRNGKRHSLQPIKKLFLIRKSHFNLTSTGLIYTLQFKPDGLDLERKYPPGSILQSLEIRLQPAGVLQKIIPADGIVSVGGGPAQNRH